MTDFMGLSDKNREFHSDVDQVKVSSQGNHLASLAFKEGIRCEIGIAADGRIMMYCTKDISSKFKICKR